MVMLGTDATARAADECCTAQALMNSVEKSVKTVRAFMSVFPIAVCGLEVSRHKTSNQF